MTPDIARPIITTTAVTCRDTHPRRRSPATTLVALVLLVTGALVTGLGVAAPRATAGPVQRVGGSDRIDTAIQIARRYADRFTARTAVLVR